MKKLKLPIVFFFLMYGLITLAQTPARINSFNIVQNSDQVLQFKSTFRQRSIHAESITTSSGTFSELQVEDFGSSNVVGEPKLPVLKQLIEVPLDAEFDVELMNYTVNEYSLEELGITFPIIPAQEPVSKSADPSQIEFIYNKATYATNSFLAHKLVDVIPVGIMRSVRVARLEVAPVLYNPVENKVRVYENIEVRIHYRNANRSKTVELKEETYSPYFEASYRMFANHQADETRTNLTRYPVKYVIVSDPMFKAALKPLIEWKTRKGFKVIEAYTDDALVGKTTTSIQKYLKDLYTAGTATDPAPSFVLFVGDVAQVPAFNKTKVPVL